MIEKVIAIQTELKAPKSQYNSFGKYSYRNVEDIQEAVKPLLKKHGVALTVSDELVQIGERYYIKATATLTDGKQSYTVTGYAREEESKKGMDSMQLTGATSSYARKYALGGLLAIDDTKDSDSINKHEKDTTEPKKDTKTDNGPNEKQVNYMYKLVKDSGKQEEVVDYIKDKFNKESSKDLTGAEVSQIIQWLKGE